MTEECAAPSTAPVKKEADFDDLLPHVGEFGRYQKLLVWFVCLPACIPCGFHAFNQLFMAHTPDHWCWNPSLANATTDQRRNASIPFDVVNGQKTYSRCEMFDDAGQVIPCLHGWEFDRSIVSSSIVIDFELVCSKALYPTIALSAMNVGGMIGVYMFGVISDKWGRKTSFFLCLAIQLLGGVLTALAGNFWLWTACRFLVGLTIPATYQIPFIIALELVGPTYRTFITVMTCIFYTMGMLLLAAVAYLVRDWVALCYATSLPFVLFFAYVKHLPESPRWLMSQGRFDQVDRIMSRCASVNGKQLPVDWLPKLERKVTARRAAIAIDEETAPPSPPIRSVGVLDLFRTPNMRLKTILITFNWFANNTVYVGLSYYGPAMGSDEYLSFFLSGLVELPGYMLCWAVMDRWGRRWPLCLLMVVGGLFCSVTVLMPPDAVTETLVLYLIAKFAIAASFLILYPFAGELYPTEIRGVGIGFTAYLGGIGLVAIPFINHLGSDWLVLPLLVMGVVSAAGGIVGLRLPETLFQKLPQTLEEGEEFGKNFGLRQCLQCWPPQTPDVNTMEMCELSDEQMPLQEGTPSTAHLRRKVRPLLVHQMSSMELPADATTGTIRLHYWF